MYKMSFLPAGLENEFDDGDLFMDGDFTETSAFKTGSSENTPGKANDLNLTNIQKNNFKDNNSSASFYNRHIQYTNDDFKMAAIKGNVELATKCLDYGIAVDQPLRGEWSASMYAANSANFNLLSFLLERGADPNYRCDMFTVLMSACSASTEDKEQVEKCVQKLVDAGAQIDAKDRYHSTALMEASKDGHDLAVKILIQKGAIINKQDYKGWTALSWAVMRGNKSVVRELLDAGADCNIPHLDKLTVKDLAGFLPSDEMLALLEHRPANDGRGDGVQFIQKAMDSSTSGVLSGVCTDAKTTDLRYGELEVFLLGLDLSHLLNIFNRQLIDLSMLLTLTEEDLIKAGVEQVGARKKILSAANDVHKKEWEASSLVSIHFGKQITCADAVAMLANSSKHLRYIGSTVVYVKEQLVKHPDSVTLPTDQVSPTQLLKHSEDALKNVENLSSQLEKLKNRLKKELRKRNTQPADLIENKSYKKSYFKRLVVLSVFGIAGACSLWWFKSSFKQVFFLNKI